MVADFFKTNRALLTDSIGDSIVVLSAYTRLQRTADMAATFSQESNFWYLTGIDEPDWKLIMDGNTGQTWLVMPDVTDVHATFDGSLSAEDAKRISGIESVINNEESIVLFDKLAKSRNVVHTIGPPLHAEHFNFALNPSIAQTRHLLENHFIRVNDISRELHGIRAIKRPEEIAAIQQAIDCTADALEVIYDKFQSYNFEYEIEADLTHLIRRAGAQGHAYDPIIAAGGNACTLHYIKNNQKIKPHQLVLIDVGASYGGYAADITRVFAKGEPTKRQQDVHRAVETAHNRIIELIGPTVLVSQYQDNVDAIMKDALRSLGLYADETSLHRYFPHAVSHGLGVDVHDSLGAPKHFKQGMVLTVEPGIYIPEENIGIRIEDDILVTKTGRKNLSTRLSTGL